jgi:hypothetical protein
MFNAAWQGPALVMARWERHPGGLSCFAGGCWAQDGLTMQ